jgi:hypothetical protein
MLINGGRTHEVNKLVQTFGAYTDFDIVIYTDQPHNGIDHDNIVNLSSVGDYRIKVQAAFNFNLKGIFIHHAYRTFSQYDRIIWVDCDVFLTGPCPHLFDQMTDGDLHARIGPFPPSNQAFDKLNIIANFIQLRPLPKTDQLPYINEVMIVVNRTPLSSLFVDKWFNLCVHSTMNWGINPCYEAVEFAIAAYGVPDLDIQELPRRHGLEHTSIFTSHRDNDMIYM